MATREVPLVEAAALLGMTTVAVRQRVKRGKTLRGTRRPDGWHVVDQPRLVTQSAATDRDQSRSAMNGHDQSQSAAATNHDRVATRDDGSARRGDGRHDRRPTTAARGP